MPRRNIARTVGKKAVVYGPLAKVVWDNAGGAITSAAHQAYVRRSARRKALDHADTLVAGAVLRVVHEGDSHWVVFSAGTPVTSYPRLPITFDRALAGADMSKLMTPDQARARRREERSTQRPSALRRLPGRRS